MSDAVEAAEALVNATATTTTTTTLATSALATISTYVSAHLTATKDEAARFCSDVTDKALASLEPETAIYVQDVAQALKVGLAISTITHQSVVRLSQTRWRTATEEARPNNSEATNKYKGGGSSFAVDDLRAMEGRSLSARPKDAEALAPGLCHKEGLLRCKTKQNKKGLSTGVGRHVLEVSSLHECSAPCRVLRGDITGTTCQPYAIGEFLDVSLYSLRVLVFATREHRCGPEESRGFR